MWVKGRNEANTLSCVYLCNCLACSAHVPQNLKCNKKFKRIKKLKKRINATRRPNDPKYICTQYRAPRHIKQVLNDLQRDINSNTIVVEDFNTPLSILDRSRRRKINKDIQDLNSDLD